MNPFGIFRRRKKKKRAFDTPDVVQCLPRYRDAINAAFYAAARKLRAAGVMSGNEHSARYAYFPKGVKLRPKGWAVPWGDGWAGGYASKEFLALVVNPKTGELNPGALAHDGPHEWGHVFLFHIGIPEEKHHYILNRAGL